MRSPHVSWVFAQLVTFPIFGPGATFGWPSQSRLRRASVSAAASGAVCQWQTSSTDRRGSGDRPLGNVPPGRSGPRRGSQVGAPPKACAKPSLASPFGGRWCPVGTVQRLTEPAGESAPTGGGEGKLPAAPSHGLYRSAGGLPSQSRLPPPSGCGSLPAKPPRRQGKSLDKEEPLVLYW